MSLTATPSPVELEGAREMRSFTRITGLLAAWLPKSKLMIGYVGDQPAVTASASSPKAALRKLLRYNLDRIRNDKMVAQHGRCVDCGRARSMHLHHVVFRSRHRDDRSENLRLICDECHNREHPT